MKLRYYLRGLAVGVILTTIILAIANAGNKPMTDAEIRKRALELGMVEGDSVKLSDVAESSDEESSESYNPSIYEEIESDSQTTSVATSDGSASPSVPPASKEEVTEPVTFTIKSGDSSYTVSQALAAAGLVEDAVEFDNFLCDNGYSRKIRTGTYEIIPGMTYEEIAKKIAR